MDTKKRGDEWEIVAIKYLQNKGYKILETNFKFGRFWEIDVIASKDSITYFIEVKLRTSWRYGTPEESITKSKLFKLEKSIYAYCFKNNINTENIAFDAIIIDKGTKSYQLKHYKNLEF